MKPFSLDQQHKKQNKALLAVLLKRRLKTIPDVIQLMEKIDTLLSEDDGIWWFNSLYSRVTCAIQADYLAGKWQHPAWLVHLDVQFAELFFEAIEQWLTEPGKAPRAWVPLFELRYRPQIAPVQFALAGVNAHINRDLALAVVRACEKTKTIPVRGTPEEQDYIHVNEILEEVEVQAMQDMARGLLKLVSTKVRPLDKKLAMLFIGWARDVAWGNAENYWEWKHVTPSDKQAKRVIKNMDRMAERMGRGMLVGTTLGGHALL